MRVAADNSDEDREREWAKMMLSSALRELTANLIRVTRGAGRSYEIGQQAKELIDAYQAYKTAVGTWPSSYELNEMLALDDHEGRGDSADEAGVTLHYGQQYVVKGALQIAASQLIGQRTQEAAGRSQLHDGLRMVEEAREMRRVERETRLKAARVSAPPKRSPSSARKPKPR